MLYLKKFRSSKLMKIENEDKLENNSYLWTGLDHLPLICIRFYKVETFFTMRKNLYEANTRLTYAMIFKFKWTVVALVLCICVSVLVICSSRIIHFTARHSFWWSCQPLAPLQYLFPFLYLTTYGAHSVKYLSHLFLDSSFVYIVSCFISSCHHRSLWSTEIEIVASMKHIL